MSLLDKELEDKQKILSALWKIQQIIVQSLEFKEVVQRIANAVLLELGQYGYVIIVLSLIDEKNKSLKRISISATKQARDALQFAPIPFDTIEIPLDATNNFCIKSLQEDKVLSTAYLSDLLTPVIDKKLADQAQEASGIKTSIVFPIHSKENSKVIGVLIFSISKDETEITSYEKEIMRGFADAVGIAVQNAQLYTALAETKEQLVTANERLKEVDKLKDEFVSLASHELRTPMTVIKSYVFMLLNKENGNLTEVQKKYLERTFSTTERLINLVNDMLNVSRIESGKLTIEPVPADIVKLVSDVVTEMQTKAMEMGINLVYTAPQVSLISNVDTNRIKEVIINLIGNSLKFTPKEGSITVTVSKNKEGFALIEVKDTGRGISSTDMARLFIKFSMIGTNNLTKDRGQGTGLGLYLSKSLVELHGGRIWVNSAGENMGSTFSFTLPLDSNEAVNPTETAPDGSIQQKKDIDLPLEPNHQE